MHQCNRCQAPLRVYQGQPVRVCDRCGAIQPGGSPGAAPPPQQGFGAPQQQGFGGPPQQGFGGPPQQGFGGPPQQGFGGPPQQGFGGAPPPFGGPVQVAMPARARGGNPVPVILAVVAVLGLLVAGLVGAVMMRGKAMSDAGFPGDVGPNGGHVADGGALWDDAANVKARIRAQLGQGARVTEVLLFQDYGFVEVLEGGRKVRYEMRGGSIKRSDSFTSPPTPGEKLEDAVMPFDDIDFKVVPAIVRQAREKVAPRPDENVHVRLARHLPFTADPQWSVYLGSGNAEFDLTGKLVGGRTSAGVDLEKEIANYFADASPVRAALERRFGASVELIELVLYPSYAIGEVRDPKQPENVDRYTIRPAGISPGDPMPNSHGGWDGKAFPLSSIDFAVVPRVAADAKSRLTGDVTHIFLEKGAIRVYVSDKRNSGYVSYRGDGTLIRVMK